VDGEWSAAGLGYPARLAALWRPERATRPGPPHATGRLHEEGVADARQAR